MTSPVMAKDMLPNSAYLPYASSSTVKVHTETSVYTTNDLYCHSMKGRRWLPRTTEDLVSRYVFLALFFPTPKKMLEENKQAVFACML